MRRSAFVVVVAIGCVAPRPPCAPSVHGRLVGCVRDASTGRPAAGAHVFVMGPGNISLGGAITDEHGEWSVDVPGSQFFVTAACGVRQERRRFRIDPYGPPYVVPTFVIDCSPPRPEYI